MDQTCMLRLLQMSLTGGAAILVILAIRLFLNKFPRRYLYLLWLIPFFKLLVPLSIPSPFSLFPLTPGHGAGMSANAGALPVLNTGLPAIDLPVNLILTKTADAVSSPLSHALSFMELIWVLGILSFLGIHLGRYLHLKKQLADSIPGGEGIYYSDHLSTPLVTCFFHPRIFLPTFFLETESVQEKEFVLAHERAHLKRFDPFFKLLAFSGLAIHWFNPLVWAAFYLFCRDMEMACDEHVIASLGEESKKAYSLALLRFEERRSGLFLPLAFGESHTKSRIKNILNYKKPAFWMTLIAVIVLIFSAFFLLTVPQDADGSGNSAVSIGIIGGADGPTSIFLAGKTGNDTASRAEELDMDLIKKQPYGMAVELDYVSAEKISLHGSFGYLVFNLIPHGTMEPSAALKYAVSLSEAGEIFMQGDQYTEIIAGDGGAMIIPDAYNPAVKNQKGFLYEEESGTIAELPELSEDLFKTLLDSNTALADAPLSTEYAEELQSAIQARASGQCLYGPVRIPEPDANVYGFLAADGENLEDIWYGIWYPDSGMIHRIPLFR